MIETNEYPYTDFHEMNLDWVIKQIRKLHVDWSDFKILNSIRFDGQWDITKQYPAWTLVNNNNLGYISKKPVPAGIALDNTDYWGLVADYSALLADMQNRIVALENRKDIKSLKDKNLIIIGDSWTVGYTESTGDGYVEELKRLNIFKSVTTFAKGGVGYIKTVDNINYITLTQDVINEYRDHPNDCNIIMYVGSVNDLSQSVSALTSACEACFNLVRSQLPDVEIYTVSTITRGINYDGLQLMEVPGKAGESHGIIHLSWPAKLLIGLPMYFTSDGYHIKHSAAVSFAHNIVNNMIGHFSYKANPVDHIHPNDYNEFFTSQLSDFSIDNTYSGIHYYNQYVVLKLYKIKFRSPTGGVEKLGSFDSKILPPIASYMEDVLIPSSIDLEYSIVNLNLYSNLSKIKSANILNIKTGEVNNALAESTFNGVLSSGSSVFVYDRINMVFIPYMPAIA